MFSNLLRYDKDKLIIFIDFETLNLCLNFCNNLPWQLGMLKVKGDQIIDSRDILIKWKTDLKISPQAAVITHFDPQKLKRDGIPPEDAFKVMHEWLEEADIIMGHNVFGFDIYLMIEWYKLNGKNPDHLIGKMIDTNLLAKAVKMNIPKKPDDDLLEWQYKIFHKRQKGLKTRLETLGKEMKIEHDYENLHDAKNDLFLNKKVWDILKYQVEI